MQNAANGDRSVNGAIMSESESPETTETTQEHTEAISFVGALCIPVSSKP